MICHDSGCLSFLVLVVGTNPWTNADTQVQELTSAQQAASRGTKRGDSYDTSRAQAGGWGNAGPSRGGRWLFAAYVLPVW